MEEPPKAIFRGQALDTAQVRGLIQERAHEVQGFPAFAGTMLIKLGKFFDGEEIVRV